MPREHVMIETRTDILFLINCLALVLVTGCGSAADPADDDATGESAESVPVSVADEKSDSVRTHELDFRIDRSGLVEGDEWDAHTIDEFHFHIDVVTVEEERVLVETDELVFRPHDRSAEGAEGWMVMLADNGPRVTTGKAFSILVWYRERGSDGRWIPIEMDVGDEEPELGRFFQRFGSEPGDRPERAAVSSIPTNRCALVAGHSDGDDEADWNSIARIPALDIDAAVEYRLVVVPAFDNCAWNIDGYSPVVYLAPMNSPYFEFGAN